MAYSLQNEILKHIKITLNYNIHSKKNGFFTICLTYKIAFTWNSFVHQEIINIKLGRKKTECLVNLKFLFLVSLVQGYIQLMNHILDTKLNFNLIR